MTSTGADDTKMGKVDRGNLHKPDAIPRREVSPYALIAIPDGIDHPKRVRR